MKKTKRSGFVILAIIMVAVISIAAYNNILSNRKIIVNSKRNDLLNDKMLSFLLETKYGSGKYEEASNNAWPEGYTLNKNLSKCENGSTLSFDEESHKVLLKAKTSDRCYIYFNAPSPDVYIATSYNGKANSVPSTVGASISLSCPGSDASFNEKYQRIEIKNVQNKYGSCSITYEGRTGSKNYLNDYIKALKTDVVDETFIGGDYTNSAALKESDYGSVSQYYSSYSGSTSGTEVTDVFTFTNNEWVTDPTKMTSGKYYYVNFTVPSDGYYELCYDISKGNSNNYIYMKDLFSATIKASASKDTSGCIDLDKLSVGKIYTLYQYAYNAISTVKFSLKKGGEKEISAGIRYEGRNPHNYVWFNNELWQIIGVFDEDVHGQNGENLVKIVKANSLTQIKPLFENAVSFLSEYYYQGKNATDTDYCVNSFHKSVCDYERTGIKSNYRGMVREVKWYYKVDATGKKYKDIYLLEREGNEYTGYVSLIYPSDYLYSATEADSSRDFLDIRSNKYELGWLFYESAHLLYGNMFIDFRNGMPRSSSDQCYNGAATCRGAQLYRPALYLKKEVYLISGDGSITNPYIIGM